MQYLWFREDDPWWATLLRALAMIALVALFLLKGMVKVPSGSKGLRTRFNKVVHHRRDGVDRKGNPYRRGDAKEKYPGLVVGIPFVHNVMIEVVTEQFMPLPEFIRHTDPITQILCTLRYEVIHLEKALVGIADYRGSLVNSCAAVVRRMVKASVDDDFLSDELVADAPILQRADDLGVRLLGLDVTSTNITDPAQLAMAFKQAGIPLTGTVLAAVATSTNGDGPHDPIVDFDTVPG
jgi:regulator of protease activity HflC (stomatin/prohibitin superfamily)